MVFACAIVRRYTCQRWVTRAGGIRLRDTRGAWEDAARTGATIMRGGSKTGTLVTWIVGVVLSVAAVAAPAWADDRVALVVGNATYEHAPALTTSLNDAADVGAALQRLGFAVTRIEDADQGELRRGLHEFATAAGAAETAVVFYAGHGIAHGGRNFLVPVDARLSSDQDIEFETVPLALVERAVGRASGVRLIILDASRESAFPVSLQRGGATGPIGPGLAAIKPSVGTLVAFAAMEGTVALDGDGRNSLYSGALLRHLEEPGVAVEHMLSKVRDAVLSAIGGTQEPSVYGSLSDRGASLGPYPASSAEAPAKATPSESGTGDDQLTAELVAAERLFWESIEDSGDPAEIQSYLDQYPDGIFAALARARLKRLGHATEPARAEAGSPSDSPAVAEAGSKTSTGLAKQDTGLDAQAVEEWLGLQPDHRRLIQSGLAQLGFDPGPLDGVFGQRTRAAIGDWQASKGMPATGYLDMEAAKALAERGKDAPSPSEQRERSRQEAMDILAQALLVVGEIEDYSDRARVLAQIAEVLVEAGDIRRAMRSIALASEAAERIDSVDDRENAHSSIAAAQAKAGEIDAAFVTLQQIKTDRVHAPALAVVAEILAKTGDTHGAAQSIDKAISTAERMKDEAYNDEYHNNLRVEALTSIGEVQARIGNREGAKKTIRRALVIAGWITEDSWHAEALAAVGETQATIGDTEGAEQTIERALAIAGRIDGDYYRASAIGKVARAQLRTGDIRSAIQSIEEAISSAGQLDADSFDGLFSIWWSLQEIAVAQVKAGDVRSAIASAGRIADAWSRGWAFRSIAEAQAEVGDIRGALATAERIADASQRDIAVVWVAAAQAEAGDINLNPAVERSGLPFLGAIVSPSARPEAVGARVDGPVVGLRGTSSALPPGSGASDPLRSTAPHF